MVFCKFPKSTLEAADCRPECSQVEWLANPRAVHRYLPPHAQRCIIALEGADRGVPFIGDERIMSGHVRRFIARRSGSPISRRPARRQEKCCCSIATTVRGCTLSREYSSTSCATTVNPIITSMLRKCRHWCHPERNDVWRRDLRGFQNEHANLKDEHAKTGRRMHHRYGHLRSKERFPGRAVGSVVRVHLTPPRAVGTTPAPPPERGFLGVRRIIIPQVPCAALSLEGAPNTHRSFRLAGPEERSRAI